jgi:hypothetical protein
MKHIKLYEEFLNELNTIEYSMAQAHIDVSEIIEEGTRGQFGKIDKEGNITSVYTHYDSNPASILPLLQNDYKNGKNVDAVIKRGDNSGLNAMNKMNFYGDGAKPTKGKKSDIAKYLNAVKDDAGAEFVYLWDESSSKWLMSDLYSKKNKKVYPAFEY